MLLLVRTREDAHLQLCSLLVLYAQEYVDRSGDVQTAALVTSRATDAESNYGPVSSQEALQMRE